MTPENEKLLDRIRWWLDPSKVPEGQVYVSDAYTHRQDVQSLLELLDELRPAGQWVARGFCRRTHRTGFAPFDPEASITMLLRGATLADALRTVDPAGVRLTDVRPLVPEPPNLKALAEGEFAAWFEDDADGNGFAYRP